MTNSEAIWNHVEANSAAAIAVSDRVWSYSELAYREFRSSAEHRRALEAAGFHVETSVGGLPTAIMGEAGSGGPVIAFLGEYDALPGLSQKAGVITPEPEPGTNSGHGCGHNLLGAAALLAALAVKDWLASTGEPGRVRYFGCPAEEGGAGKVFMVRAGAFDGVDTAITWHPASTTRVDEGQSLANVRIAFSFTGRSSHAAVAPHLGRSALDAAELMNMGVNYLREHMPSDARIHYAYLDAGGTAPNVVQAQASLIYAIRARSLPELSSLTNRVCNIAAGAALMTETVVEHRITGAYSNLLPNPALRETMHRAMMRLGPVPFDTADRALAAEYQRTFSPDHIAADYRQIGREPASGQPLFDEIVPLDAPIAPRMSSTDVADVSWVTPTVEGRIATHAMGTQPHTWQITAQGKAPAARKGMIHAAKVMAATAVDLLTNPDLLARVKDDHSARIAATPYRCPIPDSVGAPIVPIPQDMADA